jgi:hypothetical protein
VKKIIRSHEPKKALKGPQYSHDGKVTTISSTNAYGGTPFVLCIDPVNFGKIVLLNLHSKNQKSGQN